jgi:hypothetical protein
MPAWKLLLLIIVVGTVGAFGLFLLVPSARPAIVKKWFRAAGGYTPAKTPNECLEKFKECMKARDYETASDLYLTGEYKEEMRKVAKQANKLGQAIDDLWHNAFEVANLNSPNAQLGLTLLDPFPKEIKVRDIKHKEGEDKATAIIEISQDQLSQLKEVKTMAGWNADPRILLALVPEYFIPAAQVDLVYDGEKEKSWKLNFPVTSALREKVAYLKDNHGNYVQAMNNLKYAVKHEAATKGDFENQLRTEISKAK